MLILNFTSSIYCIYQSLTFYLKVLITQTGIHDLKLFIQEIVINCLTSYKFIKV